MKMKIFPLSFMKLPIWRITIINESRGACEGAYIYTFVFATIIMQAKLIGYKSSVH